MNAGLVSGAIMETHRAVAVAAVTAVGKMRGMLAFPTYNCNTQSKKWRPLCRQTDRAM